MAIHDFSRDYQAAALLQQKRRRWLLPFTWLWTGMQHVAYFFAPANECVYCWVWRMFILGALLGWHVTYLVMK